jgi:hypothetical protein
VQSGSIGCMLQLLAGLRRCIWVSAAGSIHCVLWVCVSRLPHAGCAGNLGAKQQQSTVMALSFIIVTEDHPQAACSRARQLLALNRVEHVLCCAAHRPCRQHLL